MVIGEAPGAEEAHHGRAFVGKSGQLLRATLRAVGHNDEEIYFTNVCMCRPADNATPTTQMISSCRPSLIKEIQEYAPDRVLTVGATPAQAIFPDFGKITVDRGVWRFSEECDAWVLPTLHPAFILRNPGAFSEFAWDISRLGRQIPMYTEPSYQVLTSFDEVVNQGRYYVYSSSNPYRVLDIETNSGNPVGTNSIVLSIGISKDEKSAIIIPDHLIYGPEGREVRAEIQKWFDDSKIIWAGHNATMFDAPFLKYQLGLKVKIRFDTLFAHYAIDERQGVHSLAYLGRKFFGIPDWKHEVKQYLVDDSVTYEHIPRPVLYNYQAKDTAVTWWLIGELLELLKSEDVERAFYDTILPATWCLSEVQFVGATIDIPYFEGLLQKYEKRAAEWEQKLAQLAGRADFNVRSYRHVQALLFGTLGLPDLHGGKTGVDEITPLLAVDTSGAVDLVIKTRQLKSIASKDITGMLKRVEEDGKVRSDILVHGTQTGRLSTRDPNFQNIPKLFGPEIRDGFIASDGWVLVEADYSQLELRIAAIYSGDPALRQAFIDGVDIHRYVASLMYKVPIEQVTWLQRYMAKYVDFGVLYGRAAPAVGQQLNAARIEEGLTPYEEKAATAEGQKVIDDFLRPFGTLSQWIKEAKRMGTEEGYSLTFTGRKRRFPFLTWENRGEIEREAVNTPIQGGASDICVHAQIEALEFFDRKLAREVLTVHDSVLFEVRPWYVKEFIPQLARIMENPKCIDTKGVPLVAEFELGFRWGSLLAPKTIHKLRSLHAAGDEEVFRAFCKAEKISEQVVREITETDRWSFI